MNTLRLSCPCHFGLEKVLSYEVSKIGGENIVVSDGKVTFDGNFSTLAKANLCLATAERVFIELSSFKAYSFDELFDGVMSIPLENYIGKYDAFPNKGHSLNSKLSSVPSCQAIIKKACVERLKQAYGINTFEESGNLYQIQFSIIKDEVTIYLDSTGTGLHKRGYRSNSNTAPIKETLAAGIVDLARVRSDSHVVDPFCGSGTFLIESTFKALRVAPGLRRKFSAEYWDFIPEEIWKDVRTEALSVIDKTSSFKATGYDIDEDSVKLSIGNSKKAGIISKISAYARDISDFEATENSIIICNPPYGERMLELKQAEELYKKMGQVFSPSAKNPCYIISPHEEFESFFGKKADRRRKLYNGMIKCQLFMYFK